MEIRKRMGVRRPVALGQKAVDPANWIGSDLAADKRWIYQLESRDINDMRAMAGSVKRMIGEDPNKLLSIPADAFDFGSFEARIEQMKSELKDGLGAVQIRGLPLDQIGLLDSAIIYYGLGRHIGVACSNNPEGDVFGHVTDKGKTQKDPMSRAYQTREPNACALASRPAMLISPNPEHSPNKKITQYSE